jgi:hypothetical protein
VFRASFVLRGVDRRQFGSGLADAAFCLLLGCLAAWNETLLREVRARGIPLPDLYSSGVRYAREPIPREDWLDALECFQRRQGDCEDLACWRVAELRLQGIDARPGFVRRRVLGADGAWQTIYHIVVLYPDGRIEDPSRLLGMNSIVEG